MSDLKVSNMKKFVLARAEDEGGVSGTGVVAEGVEFSNGWCALSWLTNAHSVGIYLSIKELIRIHGHGGKTVVRYLVDTPEPIVNTPNTPGPFTFPPLAPPGPGWVWNGATWVGGPIVAEDITKN